MASKRLNKLNRQRITQICIDTAFKEKREKLLALRKRTAELVWDELFSRFKDSLLSLPEHIIPKRGYVKFYIEGESSYIELPLEKTKPVPDFLYCRHNYTINEHGSARKHYAEIELLHRQIREEVELARNQICAILSQVKTFQQLYEIWPECKQYQNQFEGAPIVSPENLPSLPIPQLNALLGLSADDKAENGQEKE